MTVLLHKAERPANNGGTGFYIDLSPDIPRFLH